MAGVNHQNSDRIQQLKAFDATKAGVKGLVDAGVTKIPGIFVRPAEELAQELTRKTTPQPQLVVIDLADIQTDLETRKRVVEEVRGAAETWGFFQVVNHGIPGKVLEEMIDGIKEFNEMEAEEKGKYYSRDPTRRVRFVSNFDLFASTTANWRDTLGISFAHQFHSDQLPPPCRKSTLEYSKHIAILARTLLELLSEALGLETNHLNDMDCGIGHQMSCHYYPACPEPELTLGATKHSDVGFLTILLQNQFSGLQVLHDDQWVDVQPIGGGLVVNIGDLLQLVSNGKFISNKHRVVANSNGPRISVASFFSGPSTETGIKRYGPITELTSQENPPKYKEIVFGEYLHKFITTGLEKYLGLEYYKV